MLILSYETVNFMRAGTTSILFTTISLSFHTVPCDYWTKSILQLFITKWIFFLFNDFWWYRYSYGTKLEHEIFLHIYWVYKFVYIIFFFFFGKEGHKINVRQNLIASWDLCHLIWAMILWPLKIFTLYNDRI